VAAGTKWASVHGTAEFVLSRYLKQTERHKRRKEAAAATAVGEYLRKLSQATSSR